MMFGTHPGDLGSRRPRCAVSMAVVLGGMVALASGCKKEDQANAYKPPPPPEVVVAHPVERDVTAYLTYTGLVEASETVELRARVQGFLEKVEFQPGQRVKKGDTLFAIDKRQYTIEVDRAKAALQAAEAALQGADHDAKLARELADQHAGPEIDAIIKAAKRDVASAEVLRMRAALEDARLNLSYCDVVAPIDGRVTTNYVDVGNLVGRGEPTLLAEIVKSSPAYVSINASESDVLAVRRERQKAGEDQRVEPGQTSAGNWRPCELSMADQDNFAIKGRVDYVDPKIDTKTGTLKVRTVYENTDEGLTPGNFTRVRFPMSSEKAMLVPEAALVSDQQGRYALVVNDDDKVEQRRVTIGVLEKDMRVVLDGLEPDDRVIVLGVLRARPGSPVTPKLQELGDGSGEATDGAKKHGGKAHKSSDKAKKPANKSNETPAAGH